MLTVLALFLSSGLFIHERDVTNVQGICVVTRKKNARHSAVDLLQITKNLTLMRNFP